MDQIIVLLRKWTVFIRMKRRLVRILQHRQATPQRYPKDQNRVLE